MSYPGGGSAFVPDSPPGFFSAPVIFGTPNLPKNVPYPGTGAGGSLNPYLTWVVISNASAFPLLVASGRPISRMMPFTTDKFRLSGGSSAGLTVTPQGQLLQTGGTSLTVQATEVGYAFVTWYEEEPDGSYPSSFSDAFAPNVINTQQILFPQSGLTGLTTTIGIATFPWTQSVAFKYVTNTLGTADGIRVTAADSNGNRFQTMYPNTAGGGGWWTIPNNGEQILFTLEGMVGGVVGATFGGSVSIAQQRGLIAVPTLTAPLSQAGAAGAQVNIPGPGVVQVLPKPPTGYMLRVAQMAVQYAVAPAASLAGLLVGTVSGQTYWQTLSGNTINVNPGSGACSFYVGGGKPTQDDPAEGLSYINQANQAATVNILADIVPFPQMSGL